MNQTLKLNEMRGGRRSRRHFWAIGGMFFDRWSLVVVRDMMFSDRRHFRGILRGAPEGIASNILADRLKQLLASGLVTSS
jgi:DNA-binding HxlR family transcriptional regulator